MRNNAPVPGALREADVTCIGDRPIARSAERVQRETGIAMRSGRLSDVRTRIGWRRLAQPNVVCGRDSRRRLGAKDIPGNAVHKISRVDKIISLRLDGETLVDIFGYIDDALTRDFSVPACVADADLVDVLSTQTNRVLRPEIDCQQVVGLAILSLFYVHKPRQHRGFRSVCERGNGEISRTR